MDKKIIAIVILAVLFLGKCCSSCSSNRHASFREVQYEQEIDSLNGVAMQANAYATRLEKQVDSLKAENTTLRAQKQMLENSVVSLKEDKKNLQTDKNTLNKIITTQK